MRRVPIALTMLAAAGMLAAGCGGNNSGSGGRLRRRLGDQRRRHHHRRDRGDHRQLRLLTDNPAGQGGPEGHLDNQQDVAHTVTADEGAFDHSMPAGARFAFAFTKAGSCAYHWTIHPAMHATIVVS